MSVGDYIRDSQIWKSIFRHPAPYDRRNRVVVMLTNFFLHLHPVSIKQQGIALSYTWCMGGITFFLFLVETITGVLLMFYYRPTLEWAFNDILALRDVTTLGIMREIHRWGAHAMVITVWLHMYRVFLTGSYKPPREFNWVVGVLLLVLTLLLSFTGYLVAVGPVGDLGHHRRIEHGTCHSVSGARGAGCSTFEYRRLRPDHQRERCALFAPGRTIRGRSDAQSVLHSALRGDSAGCGWVNRDPFLARAQGRRHQPAALIDWLISFDEKGWETERGCLNLIRI